MALLLLIAAGLTALATAGYARIFPWVLTFNLQYPPGVLTPWIETWTSERDGIEIYVVYTLVFAIIGLSALIFWLLSLFPQSWPRAVASVVGAVLTGYYISKYPAIGVLGATAGVVGVLVVPVLLLLVCGLGSWSQKGSAVLVLAILLVPACFTVVGSFSAGNYAYVFSPAQKLLDGARIQDIYFQYDFMLSAMVAIWMKAGFALDHFQYVGSGSVYLGILAVFFVGYRLFETRYLAFALALCVLVFRVLANVVDPVFVLQVTPLRLEIWIVLVLAITFRGATGLLVPLACGLLLLIQGNFGTIYTVGYFQLILTLAAIDILDAGWRQKLQDWTRPRHLLRCALIAIYLLGCLLLSRYLFGASSAMTAYYQRIGIGFLPMPLFSLFWLLPVVLSGLWTSLFLIRRHVSRTYLSVGFAALYFFVGNCIYFFGRSHEQNLFNIGISLIFVVFIAIDVFSRFIGPLHHLRWRSGAVGAVTGIAVLIGFAVSNLDMIERNLFAKGAILSGNAPEQVGTFADLQPSVDAIVNDLDRTLGKGARVQFLTIEDAREFMFYQGDQQSLSFAYPYAATVFTSGLVIEARDMIADGYYLLMDSVVAQAARAAGLSVADYGYEATLGGYQLIGKSAPPSR